MLRQLAFACIIFAGLVAFLGAFAQAQERPADLTFVPYSISVGVSFVVMLSAHARTGVQLDLAYSDFSLFHSEELAHLGLFATATWVYPFGWRFGAGAQTGFVVSQAVPFTLSGALGVFYQLPSGPFPSRIGLRIGALAELAPLLVAALRVPLALDVPLDRGSTRSDFTFGLGLAAPTWGVPLVTGW